MAFQAYPSIGNKPPEGWEGAEPWVAVPKLHGSNMQFDVVRDAATGAVEVRAGRRGGYLGRTKEGVLTNPLDDDHYGSKAVVAREGMEGKLRSLLAAVGGGGARCIAYCEVYGGQYGPTAAPGQAGKPVQKHVWYARRIHLAFFDLWVEGRGFLPFDEAAPLFAAAGLPALPAVHRGTYAEVRAWAVANTNANATAHWNPEGLPALEGNEGEGFVIRAATAELATPDGDRALFKIKNPRFREIAEAGSGSGGQGSEPPPGCPCMAGAQRVLDAAAIGPNRVAAVLSKEAEADCTMARLRLLAQKVLDDAQAAVAEEGHADWWPTPHEGKCTALAALRSAACKALAPALQAPAKA